MTDNTDTLRELAENIRISAKQLRWAASNLAAVYNLIKPDDRPPLEEDPHQTKLFDDESTGI